MSDEQEATEQVEDGQEPQATDERETPAEGDTEKRQEQESQDGDAKEGEGEEGSNEDSKDDRDSLMRKLSTTRAEAANWRTQLREAQARLADAKTPEQVAEITRELTERADALETELLRTKVASKFGLPADLAARLQGKDEAALEADAKVLAQYVGGNSSRGSGGLDPLDDEDPLPSNPRELAKRARSRRR